MSNQQYVKLSEHLPLDTPFTLMIDPSNKCNFKCTFCPTGDEKLLASVGRPIGQMPFETFTKIVDDLKDFPRSIRSIRLFKDGEPFLHKDMVKMINYVKEAKVADEIYVISNGSLITESIAHGILDAGLDRLRISVEHVSSEKYKQITQTYGNYERIIKNVRFLFEERNRRGSSLFINPKIVDTGLTSEELETFRKDFGPISDDLTIETLMGWSYSDSKDWTLGSNPTVGIDGKAPISEVDVCPEPFKGMAINFDGSVSVCCVDWSHGTVIGDATKERVIDIWNGPRMGAFRLAHLTGRRSEISACAGCQYLKGHKPLSHLDAEKGRLTPVYEQLHDLDSRDPSLQTIIEGPKAGKSILKQIIHG